MKILPALTIVVACAAANFQAYADVYDTENIVPDPDASSFKSLVVNLHDGSQVQIGLSADLSTTFDGSNMVFSSPDSSVEVPVTDIASWFYHPDECTGIEGITKDEFGIQLDGRTIRMTNLPAKSSITVHDIKGKLLQSTSSDDSCVINMNNFRPGIYILSVNNQSFKLHLAR